MGGDFYLSPVPTFCWTVDSWCETACSYGSSAKLHSGSHHHSIFKGEVRSKMNFIYVLGFVVLRDVVKVFPVSSPSFARKTTGRNRARSHSGA